MPQPLALTPEELAALQASMTNPERGPLAMTPEEWDAYSSTLPVEQPAPAVQPGQIQPPAPPAPPAPMPQQGRPNEFRFLAGRGARAIEDPASDAILGGIQTAASTVKTLTGPEKGQMLKQTLANLAATGLRIGDEIRASVAGEGAFQLIDQNNKALQKKLTEAAREAAPPPANTEGISAAFEQGDYESAGKNIAQAFVQNLPQIAAMLITKGRAGAAIGVVAGGSKLQQLEEEYPDMDPQAMRVNAAATGLIEGLSETLGEGAIVKRILGTPAGKAAVKGGFVTAMKEVFRGAAIEGLIEEPAATLGENIVDIISGTKDPSQWSTGLKDSAILGSILGGTVTSASLATHINSALSQDGSRRIPGLNDALAGQTPAQQEGPADASGIREDQAQVPAGGPIREAGIGPGGPALEQQAAGGPVAPIPAQEIAPTPPGGVEGGVAERVVAHREVRPGVFSTENKAEVPEDASMVTSTKMGGKTVYEYRPQVAPEAPAAPVEPVVPPQAETTPQGQQEAAEDEDAAAVKKQRVAKAQDRDMFNEDKDLLDAVPDRNPAPEPRASEKPAPEEKERVQADVKDPFKKPSARNIEAEGKLRHKGGFASLPADDLVPRRPNRQLRRLKRLFSPTKGTDRKFFDLYVAKQTRISGSELNAKIDGRRIQNAIEAIAGKKAADQEAVRNEMLEVLNGDMTVDELAAAHGIDPKAPEMAGVKLLYEQKKLRQEMLANLPGMTAKLREVILDNESYQTRVYERWILGDKFDPNPEDYRNAITQMEDELSANIDKISDRAQKLATKKTGRKGVPPSVVADVGAWLETGDATILEGLAKGRQRSLRALRNDFMKVQDLVDTIHQNEQGELILLTSVDRIASAAKDVVDYHLGKLSSSGVVGGMDTTNLKKRTADAIKRALYSEITDPIFVAAQTAEVQGKMLEEAAFFQKMYDQGLEKWWWERPGPGRVQMGAKEVSQDRLKYGKMAGKWVTEETYDLLHPKAGSNGASSKIADALWLKPMATMRLMKLFGFKTVIRNYVTAYTGFAMGSGDAYLPTFNKHFAEAHRLAVAYAKKDIKAMETMRDLANMGVFSASASSMLQDIEAHLSTAATTKAERALAKAGMVYSFIDFPTKYAAYMARIDDGMTPARAAKHVRDLYQNRDEIPNLFPAMSKFGVADYIGYTYDSSRIAVNQVKWAAAEAQEGRLRPLVGLLASHGLQATMWNAAARAAAGAIWGAIHRGIRREKDVEKVTQFSDVQQVALRDFLPEYYEGATMAAWEEHKKGSKELYFVILSGQSAWAMEDWLVGMGQAAKEGDGSAWKKGFINYAGERFGPGMMIDAAFTAINGEPLFAKYKREGISDLAINDPHKIRIVAEAAAGLMADIYGGQPGQWAKQYYDWAKGREYREKQAEKGSYVPSRTQEDIFWARLAPVRTYRITKGDMERRLRSRAKDYTVALSKAKADGNESYRIEMLRRLQGVVNNAKTISGDWFSETEYKAMLQDARNISVEEADAVVRDRIEFLRPYKKQERKSQLERTR